MKNFKSLLFLQTDCKKELKLPETESIHAVPGVFAIHPSQTFFCSFNEGINVFSINPMNLIKKIPYANVPNHMIFIEDFLVLINNESVAIHGSGFFNSLSRNFTNTQLVRIHEHPHFSKKTCLVGIQSCTTLKIYDFAFSIVAEIECQCAYSARNLLITGFFNTLTIATGYSTVKVKLPGNVVKVVTDETFSNIYAACDDNKIYKVSMRGDDLLMMEYHESKIVDMQLSICGEYLYSADSKWICIWNAGSGVIMGFVEVEGKIKNINLVVEGDRIISELYKNIL